MLVINIGLFILQLGLQIFYIFIFKEINSAVFIVAIARISIGIFLKLLFMFLTQEFGKSVNVKVFVQGNGDQLILGTDENEKILFQFTIENSKKTRVESDYEVLDKLS